MFDQTILKISQLSLQHPVAFLVSYFVPNLLKIRWKLDKVQTKWPDGIWCWFIHVHDCHTLIRGHFKRLWSSLWQWGYRWGRVVFLEKTGTFTGAVRPPHIFAFIDINFQVCIMLTFVDTLRVWAGWDHQCQQLTGFTDFTDFNDIWKQDHI